MRWCSLSGVAGRRRHCCTTRIRAANTLASVPADHARTGRHLHRAPVGQRRDGDLLLHPQDGALSPDELSHPRCIPRRSFDCIERFHNLARRHSALGNQSPVDSERMRTVGQLAVHESQRSSNLSKEWTLSRIHCAPYRAVRADRYAAAAYNTLWPGIGSSFSGSCSRSAYFSISGLNFSP